MPIRQQARSGRLVLAVSALAAALIAASPGHAGNTGHPFDLTVENASAKVGESGEVIARVNVEDGYQFSKSYRNRIIELSAFEDAVDFDGRVISGKGDAAEIVFSVGVTPTKPGTHPINGVFRIGYHDGQRMRMVSVPLKATVTGTE